MLQVVWTNASSLSHVPFCRYCREKWFTHETNGFCCADDIVSLVHNEVLAELYHRLYTSGTAKSMKFLTNLHTITINLHSHHLEISDRTLYRMNRGIYTFWAQVKIYHYIGDLKPIDGRPSYCGSIFMIGDLKPVDGRPSYCNSIFMTQSICWKTIFLTQED